jgi:ubiquinone/menaquinone biosynthesis C-methylase UbiE
MRRHRWAVILGGGMLTGGAIIAAYVARSRRAPSACPYSQSIVLEFPRPFFTRDRLRQLLDPRPGERVLEVGPGRGYYALDVASRLFPGGTLDVFDLQQGMLDVTMRRAGERSLTNIVPTQGDAQALPYADGTFDAAYLVATLGEVPDQEAAVRELRRVLRPGGRLVVGEGLPDPHMIPFNTVRRRAEAAGLHLQHRHGGRLGYFASFRVP